MTVDAGKSQAGSRNWPVPEFFALLAAHITCRYESLITYYGVYSSSHRGKLKRENRGRTDRGDPGGGCAGDFRYAAAFKLGEMDSKICETDPLTCSECGEPMRIIAFITDPLEVAKILEHIGEQTSSAPPLMPSRSRSLILRLRRYELSIP